MFPSKLYQPSELRNRANIIFGRWFVIQARMMILALSQPATENAASAAAALSEHLTLIRHYLDHYMPKCKLLNDTLAQRAVAELLLLHWYFNQSILQKNNLLIANGVNVIEGMIEILFAAKVMRLYITDSVLSMFRTTFCFKSYKFKSLIDLSIFIRTEIKKKSAHLETDIINMIKELQNLKYLAIIHFCSDNILRCIASNCPLIEELNLSFPGAGVTDSSMDIISQLRNLRIIIMDGTRKVTEKGIRTLLLTCEKVEHIRLLGRTNEVTRALNRIGEDVTNFTKTFQIKTYWSQNDTLQELTTVVRMCPGIQQLTFKHAPVSMFFDPHYGHHEKNLHAIKGLSNLRELDLVNNSFYKDDVDKILQAVGHNLTSLSFKHVEEMNLKALIHISITCPKLKNLSFNNCKFNRDPLLSTNELNVLTFIHLKNIYVNWSYGGALKPPSEPREHLGPEISFMLLSNCLTVETIKVGGGVWLTEHTMSRILDKNPLRHLKLLEIGDFSNTHEAITAPILHRIIKNCVNRPRIKEKPRIVGRW